jgi:hypothetical protein
MFFKKNKRNEIGCPQCSSKINDNFSFCPYCGINLVDKEKEFKDFGMLGKNDVSTSQNIPDAGFGFTDKLISTMMNSIVKNLEHLNLEEADTNANIHPVPRGIKISFGVPRQRKRKNEIDFINRPINEEQLARMSNLPRINAKTNVRRFSDRILYEITAPGVSSPNDIFLTKTESGYELKAIAENKVYVNSFPIEFPLRAVSIDNDKVLIEFYIRG